MARKTTMPTSTAIKSNEVFVDTGGWFAVAAEEDKYHKVAARYFESQSAVLSFTVETFGKREATSIAASGWASGDTSSVSL